MKTKRIILFLICIVVAITICSIYFGAEKSRVGYAKELKMVELSSEEYHKNVNKSVGIFSQAMSPFIETASLNGVNNSEDSSGYNDDFGGAFIDDNGVLNIGTTLDNSHYKSLKAAAVFDGQVQYVRQMYSYNYLRTLQDIIIKTAEGIDNFSIALDEERNKVIVSLSEKIEKKQLIEQLQREKLYNENAIELIVDTNSQLAQKANTAYGGDALCTQVLGFSTFRGTICANAIDNETGKYGILTNLHVARDRVLHADGFWGPKIGTASKGIMDDTVDAAFVPFENQAGWSPTSRSRFGDTTFTGVKLGDDNLIIQGMPVRKIGQTSGITIGTIISTTFVANINSVDFGAQSIRGFSYTNDSFNGDSGGPVYFDGGGQNLWLIGMNFAGPVNNDPGLGIGCRISEVMKKLKVTPISNYSLFATTDLPNNEIRIESLNMTFPSAPNPASTTIRIPAEINGRTVTEIGAFVFFDQHNITNIEMPQTLKKIWNEAFACCDGLKNLSIPASVTSVGADAFYGCPDLSITWNYNPALSTANFIQYVRTLQIPWDITEIPVGAFKNCTSLKRVIFEYNSQLEQLRNDVFSGCSGLESVSFGFNSQLTSIEYKTFYNCTSLWAVDFGYNSRLYELYSYAFYGCTALKTITLPSSLVYIGPWAFEGCGSLESVYFDWNSSLQSIGQAAFYNCRMLRNIIFPESLELIGDYAFSGCYCLNAAVMPSVTYIGNYAFSGCYGMQSIIMSNNLECIGEAAFASCYGTKSIAIPASVPEIYSFTFASMYSLKTVYIERPSSEGITELRGGNVFSSCYGFTKIYVPDAASLIAYQNAEGWSEYASIMEVR